MLDGSIPPQQPALRQATMTAMVAATLVAIVVVILLTCPRCICPAVCHTRALNAAAPAKQRQSHSYCPWLPNMLNVDHLSMRFKTCSLAWWCYQTHKMQISFQYLRPFSLACQWLQISMKVSMMKINCSAFFLGGVVGGGERGGWDLIHWYSVTLY